MELKNWTGALAGLNEANLEMLHETYSQMLATAHDLGYQAPDDQLVETDDEEVLRKVIPPLHAGIIKFHAGLDKPRVETAGAKGKKEPAKKKAAVKKAAKKTKVSEKAAESVVTEQQESDMDAAKKTVAKKGAKKAVAKKAVAKKGAKAATANARTPVERKSKWSDKAKIKVLVKDNPCRKGTGRFDRVANLMKHDGKLVSEFLTKGKGKPGTLAYSAEQEWVKVVG